MTGLAHKLWLALQSLLDETPRREAHGTEKTRRNSPAHRAMHRDSLYRLTSAPRNDVIAMVGVAPPTRSGIATFNQAILTGLATEVDFFGDFSTLDDLQRMADAVAAAPRLVRVFCESAFFDAVQLNSYRAAIFVLGNSDQNVLALRASHLAEAAGVRNILFYAHDPFLFNLYLSSVGEDRQRFRAEMMAAYGRDALQERAIECLSWPPDLRDLFRNRWLTLRPLLQGRNVSGIIVNSNAARELVEAEVQDLLRRDAIHVLFHPILPLTPTASAGIRGTSRLRIGTFGIPDPVKRTERIIAAWRRIKTIMPDAELILAGYFASVYAAENSLDPNERGLHLVDSPSEAELVNLMGSVDVAVQLRSENRGESSGIVHQLLGLGRRVIVSALGSYRDLDDAVVQIPTDASEATIAQAILDSSLDETLSERAAAYAHAHSLARYQQEFRALLDSIES